MAGRVPSRGHGAGVRAHPYSSHKNRTDPGLRDSGPGRHRAGCGAFSAPLTPRPAKACCAQACSLGLSKGEGKKTGEVQLFSKLESSEPVLNKEARMNLGKPWVAA